MFFGLKGFGVNIEKGIAFSSPGASSSFVKSTEDLFNLGGVPVLSLPKSKPLFFNDSVNPKDLFSPILPPL